MAIRSFIITLVGLAVTLAMGLLPATARAQKLCPKLAAEGPGVERIEGQGSYSFYGTPTIIVDQPVIALVDDSYTVRGLEDQFPSSEGQVIGRITSDFFTSPFSFTINLPMLPNGATVDVDQDGEEDTGVQVLKVVLGQNVLNTPFLENFTQAGILVSYIKDPETDAIVAGDLVLYAPDDAQRFPCGVGEDGLLFTEDDPVAALPAGYTIAHIADGMVTFDRSTVGKVQVGEDPGVATPDFSEQGIVESYDTLIDFLKERYVFNAFAGIDWDALAAQFRPQVEQAEQENNLGRYFLALFGFAQAIGDAHVYVQPGQSLTTPEAIAVFNNALAYTGAGLGAGAVELDDGRFVISDLVPNGPAAQAGLTFGTELVTLNGLSIEDALTKTPYPEFPGTDEARRLSRLRYLLNAPLGTSVEVGYRLPYATKTITDVITAAAAQAAASHDGIMPMEYRIVDGFGYVEWPAFERSGIAGHIFADFIKQMNQQQIPGIILDLRGNGGGTALLQYAIMSYLYSAEHPFTFANLTQYEYDIAKGEFITDTNDAVIAAPPGVGFYAGQVIVLIDNRCASACEFMSYYLQESGRATIAGQYASAGAGGNTNQVILPGGITFNYTAGTDLLNATQKPAFQGVGVLPDVRVPVTEATERAKLQGGDPVLDAAIAYLREQSLDALDLEPAPFASGTITAVAPSNWQPDPSFTQFTSPDGTSVLTFGKFTRSDATESDAVAAAINNQAEKYREYKTDSATWSLYHSPYGTQLTTIAVTVLDGVPYIGLLVAQDKVMLDLLTTHVLEPALDAFQINNDQ